ncbi:hypothetical protein BJ742DRAFT_845347 [Cladochytrium replicatum]|nr:hypothetical protein BJ742DRAFT_845347 [Cladochytrium replicatum]
MPLNDTKFPEFALGTDAAERFKEELRVQVLQQLELNDDDLPDFIFVMVAHGRTRGEVYTELSDILGDDNDPSNFVDWIFTHGLSMVAGQPETNGGSQAVQYASEEDVVQLDPDAEDFDDGETYPAETPHDQQSSPSRKRTLDSDTPKQTAYSAPNISSNAESADERPAKFSKIVWDLGPEPPAATPPDPLSRPLPAGRRRVDNTTFTIANDNPPPAPMRCRFFPKCTREGCEFFHPTQPCAAYPNCPNTAETCLYIHPTPAPVVAATGSIPGLTPCRFGAMCTRPGCHFAHPSPASLARMGGAGPGASRPQLNIPCKFYPNCSNPQCPYVHPYSSILASSVPFATSVQAVPAAGSATGPESEIPCRYEPFCTRPGCRFKHGPVVEMKNASEKYRRSANGNAQTHISARLFAVEGDEIEKVVAE